MPENKSLEEKDAQEVKQAELQAHIRWSVGNYRAPKSPAVQEHLEWFRDQKFGLMIHWGLYCQLGLKESWPLVDNGWSKWQFQPGTTNLEVKQMYAQLHKGFLPLRFTPYMAAGSKARILFAVSQPISPVPAKVTLLP